MLTKNIFSMNSYLTLSIKVNLFDKLYIPELRNVPQDIINCSYSIK